MLTAQEDQDNGCIINTCVQVASDPTKLAISCQMGNLTREMVEKTGQFNVSVLTEDVPFETIRHFGMQTGREVNKFEHFVGFDRSANGLIYLTDHTNAMFSCKVLSKQDLGSHMLFIGEVTEAKVLSKQGLGSHMLFIGEVTEAKVLDNKPSCTYAHYHKAIKPKF